MIDGLISAHTSLNLLEIHSGIPCELRLVWTKIITVKAGGGLISAYTSLNLLEIHSGIPCELRLVRTKIITVKASGYASVSFKEKR